MTETPFCYYATLLAVVDADTFKLNIDEGFHHTWETNCRLAHINAPELSTTKGKEAKAYVVDRIPVGTKLYIISRTLDKYGRPIAEVYMNGVNINEELVNKGYAVKYM